MLTKTTHDTRNPSTYPESTSHRITRVIQIGIGHQLAINGRHEKETFMMLTTLSMWLLRGGSSSSTMDIEHAFGQPVSSNYIMLKRGGVVSMPSYDYKGDVQMNNTYHHQESMHHTAVKRRADERAEELQFERRRQSNQRKQNYALSAEEKRLRDALQRLKVNEEALAKSPPTRTSSQKSTSPLKQRREPPFVVSNVRLAQAPQRQDVFPNKQPVFVNLNMDTSNSAFAASLRNGASGVAASPLKPPPKPPSPNAFGSFVSSMRQPPPSSNDPPLLRKRPASSTNSSFASNNASFRAAAQSPEPRFIGMARPPPSQAPPPPPILAATPPKTPPPMPPPTPMFVRPSPPSYPPPSPPKPSSTPSPKSTTSPRNDYSNTASGVAFIAAVTAIAADSSPSDPFSNVRRSESEKRIANRCRELLEQKLIEEALIVCDEWKRLNPSSSEAWLLSGRAHLLRGDVSQAEKNMASALAFCSGNLEQCAMVNRHLNNVKMMSFSRDKAMEELSKRGNTSLIYTKRALELAPFNAQLRVLAAAAQIMAGSSSPAADVNTSSSSPKAIVNNGALDACRMELDKAIQCSTRDLIMQIGRPAIQHSRTMHRVGFTKEAQAFLKCVCERSPTLNLCAEELDRLQTMDLAKMSANEAYAKSNFQDAIRLFTEALKLEPSNDSYNSVLLSNRAAAFMAIGDFVRAVDDCDAALRLFPSFLRVRLRRARALLRMGKFRECVADYELALRANPGSVDVANELSEARKAWKEHVESKKMFHSRVYPQSSSSSSSTWGGASSSANRPAGGGFTSDSNQQAPPPPQPDEPQSGPSFWGRARKPSTTVQDLYSLLGVTPNASSADIKKAYHRAALKHHPDKNVGDDSASQRFKHVLDAFHTLIDPQSRRRYDVTHNSVYAPAF